MSFPHENPFSDYTWQGRNPHGNPESQTIEERDALKASLRAIVARTRCSSYHESQDCYDIAVAALKEKT